MVAYKKYEICASAVVVSRDVLAVCQLVRLLRLHSDFILHSNGLFSHNLL